MEEFDEVKWDNERLKGECDRLKKLLAQKHKKMEKLHQESQATVKALEERLGQEEVKDLPLPFRFCALTFSL